MVITFCKYLSRRFFSWWIGKLFYGHRSLCIYTF